MSKYCLKNVVSIFLFVTGLLHAANEQSVTQKVNWHEATNQGTGRCLPFFNATKEARTLRLEVPGRWYGSEIIELSIEPNNIVSFNHKPALSVAEGITGAYTYVVEASLDESVLPAHEVEKLNKYLAQYLDDKKGCRESKDAQTVAVSIIDDTALQELSEGQALGENALATFENGYHLLLPIAEVRKKSSFARLFKHAKQHAGKIVKSLGAMIAALPQGDVKGFFKPVLEPAFKTATGAQNLKDAAKKLRALGDDLGAKEVLDSIEAISNQTQKLFGELSTAAAAGIKDQATKLIALLRKAEEQKQNGGIDEETREEIAQALNDLVAKTKKDSEQVEGADQEADVAAGVVAAAIVSDLAEKVLAAPEDVLNAEIGGKREYTWNEATKKGTGRCLAFFNATDTEQALVLVVPGRLYGEEKIKVIMQPNTLVSFNRKPALSLIKGTTGKYTYILGAELNDHALSKEDAEKLNNYLAQHLDDRAGCREEKEKAKKVAVSLIDEAEKEALVIALTNDDALKTANENGTDESEGIVGFGNGYYLLLPTDTIKKKTAFNRIIKHTKQHGVKAIKGLGNMIKNVPQEGIIKGVFKPVLGEAFKTLSGVQNVKDAAYKLESIARDIGAGESLDKLTEIKAQTVSVFKQAGAYIATEVKNKSNELFSLLAKAADEKKQGSVSQDTKEKIEELANDLIGTVKEDAQQVSDTDSEVGIAAETVVAAILTDLAGTFLEGSETEKAENR